MQACQSCGTQYQEGIYFCEQCGDRIRENVTTFHARDGRETHLASDRTLSKVPTSDSYSSVLLYVSDSRTLTPIILSPRGRTVLGRFDRAYAHQPDVDLTPYGALKKGVSRIHAALDQIADRPAIMDIGSTNGVAVNGDLLAPGKSHYLCDGDVIHLGDLEAHIYFE